MVTYGKGRTKLQYIDQGVCNDFKSDVVHSKAISNGSGKSLVGLKLLHGRED